MGGIELYGHGGDLYTASSLFHIDPSKLLDFSANINPLGPPLRVMEALQRELANIIHYPDPIHRSFREALAHRLGVDPSWILAGNGAAECMQLAVLALNPSKVGVVYPCFSEYAQLSRQIGAKVKGIYGEQERNFKPDMDELHHLFHEVELIFIGHPNNPTGILYTKEELQVMAEWTEETCTFLVVDEAFLDFLPQNKQNSLIDQLKSYPKLILIRSMTKFYAIPGLRLGYAVAHPHVIEAMKDKQVTWSVNQLALLAGERCLQERDYEEETRKLIQEERSYLQHVLEYEHGWQVCPGKANFLLIRLPKAIKALELQRLLGERGILIRNCAMYPGLADHDFRIAVRSRAENERFITELGKVLNKGDER